MSDTQKSTICWHEDGYIEVVFAGFQRTPELRRLINQAKAYAAATEDVVSLLVDARNGRISRDARTFTLLMDIGWIRNLENFVILYSDDPHNKNSATPSSVVVSVLSNGIGVRPHYINDEAKARAIVSGRGKD